MRNLLSLVFHFSITAACVLLVAATIYNDQYISAGPNPEAQEFIVAPGQNANQISQALQDQGLLESPYIFRTAIFFNGLDRKLRIGHYLIPAHASVRDTIDALVEGDSIQVEVTLIEGQTSLNFIRSLANAPYLVKDTDQIPEEGSMLPQTYLFERGTRTSSIVKRLQAEQQKVLTAAWNAKSADSQAKSPRELLILASIIEKETAVASERRLVASVFNNRLKKKMKMQSDPTIIYGLVGGEGKLGRAITRSDIKSQTPYNTYVIPRLPPTPIASPSEASIVAAAMPMESDYVYFVADGTGGHAFAKTLSQHRKNVSEWRKIERKQRAKNN